MVNEFNWSIDYMMIPIAILVDKQPEKHCNRSTPNCLTQQKSESILKMLISASVKFKPDTSIDRGKLALL